MANTPQGGRASPLLRAAAILFAVVTVAHAQDSSVGFQGFLDYITGVCPSYQTTSEFTQSFIDQMRATEEGFILALSTGHSDACQRIAFTSEDEFKYTFIDIANFPRTFISSYEVNVANLTHPAQIKLNMLPGLLGSDTAGRLSLTPLKVDQEKIVVAACWQRGYFKREQLQVFIPFGSTASPAEIKADLVNQKVVGANVLNEISQNCNPGLRMAPTPIPLRFYNLILALDSPSTADSSSALAPVSGTSRNANRPTFQNGATGVGSGLNFQQAVVPNFATQFSPVYQLRSALPGSASYSSSQGSPAISTEPHRYIRAKLSNNHFTRFYF